MRRVIHYDKFYNNLTHQNIYMCPTIEDMHFIPKEHCSTGDEAHINGLTIVFVFNGADWEEKK